MGKGFVLLLLNFVKVAESVVSCFFVSKKKKKKKKKNFHVFPDI